MEVRFAPSPEIPESGEGCAALPTIVSGGASATLRNCGETEPAFEGDRSRTGIGIEPCRFDGLAGHCATQRVGQLLSREGQRPGGDLERPFDVGWIRHGRSQVEHHHRRGHFRHRAKGPRMNIKGGPTLSPGGPFQSHEPMVSLTGLGHDAHRHFTLQHHHKPGEEVMSKHESSKDGGAHRVRKIGRQLPWPTGTGNLSEERGERICVDDLETPAAKALFEGLYQTLVEFDRPDTIEPGQQRFGQRASSGADFDDPRRLRVEEINDPVGDILVDEKILAQSAAFGSAHDSTRFQFSGGESEDPTTESRS